MPTLFKGITVVWKCFSFLVNIYVLHEPIMLSQYLDTCEGRDFLFVTATSRPTVRSIQSRFDRYSEITLQSGTEAKA